MSEPSGGVVGQRVLIVEDELVNRLLSCEALAALGMEPLEAVNGQEALDAVAISPPDLVILDLGLPGRNGLEICAALRELPGGRDIPIMIMTGSYDSATIDRAFQAGATDFVAKPVDWPLLQHRIRFLMRAQGAFAELRQTLGALIDSQSRLAHAQQLAQLGNWEWVPGAEEMLWSEQVYQIFEIPQTPGASCLASFLSVAHPEDREDLEKAMTRAAAESTSWSLDHRIVLRDGQERVVRQQAEASEALSGQAHHIAGTIQDITDRHHAEEQIRRLAYYDDLTALPNRKMLTEQLDRVLGRAEQTGESVGLLFFDLDRFKRINDTLGHRLGDSVLKAFADRLFQSVRCLDYVGDTPPPEAAWLSRLGGDEFVVLLRGLSSSADAAHVARRMLEEIQVPLMLEGRRIDLSASLGIALYPADGRDSQTLLGNASVALDQAKGLGRDGYQFFDESMNERALHNMQLESGLRSAIGRGELILHYQPQFDAQSGQIVSVEALVRWDSVEHGFISPADFIPLAEESGLIVPLGEWVLRTACAQNRAWHDAGLTPIRVAVNVSSHQVRKGGLVEMVERALRDAPLAAQFLEIEITESALIGNEFDVVETLERLHGMGIRLALDDFGTGYSSLSHLVQFPIDTLKIDQSFVGQIGASPTAEAITSAVLTMGQNLGLEVVAEGVETEQQQQFLNSRGCELIQGYLLSRPIAPRDLENLLRASSESPQPQP